MKEKRQAQGRNWLAVVMVGILVTLSGLATSVMAGSLPPPPGLAAPAQPTPMPAFNLVDGNGTTIRSADLHGKVVLVRFWATW